MNNAEKAQLPTDSPNSFWFVLAACFTQFVAPAAGMFLFDLFYFPSISIITGFVFGIGRILLGTWQLAIEPLTVAVLLTFVISVNLNRRKAVPIIVAITLVNMLVSGFFIVARSL